MLQTFQKARELGLTVLRMWAFADGPYEWNALQPELELLDDRVLRRARRCPAAAQHLTAAGLALALRWKCLNY